MMLETGRARTFNQRSSPEVDQAVASCPVDCMHPVTFRELKEFEEARDQGDGRDDHKYLGQKQTPIHVVDSDHNRRSSWYHTLKHKCLGKLLSYPISCTIDYRIHSPMDTIQSPLSVHKKDAMTVQNSQIRATIRIIRRTTGKRNILEHYTTWKMAMLIIGERLQSCK